MALVMAAAAFWPAFCASQNSAWLRTWALWSFFASSIMAGTASGSLLTLSPNMAFSRTRSLASWETRRRRTSYPRCPRALPSQKVAFSRKDSGCPGVTNVSSAWSAAGSAWSAMALYGGLAAAMMAFIPSIERELGQERDTFTGRYAGEPVNRQSAGIQLAVR
jgi:hypothetical protein